ncbi:MAG: hypothetical protein ACOZCO_15360 [Bacteroidota bacterium]
MRQAIRPYDLKLSRAIKMKLISFNNIIPLTGVRSNSRLDCFTAQIIDSIRRVKYIEFIKNKPTISDQCQDPNHIAFDPLKAAILHYRKKNYDEAFWLVFLSTHFGKNGKSKWSLTAAVYGGLGQRLWTWDRIINNQLDFLDWLRHNQTRLKSKGKFGNHRKYASLKPKITGGAITSYINWIGSRGHISFLKKSFKCVPNNKRDRFDTLYNSMQSVQYFGRMGIFDYLTMIGKLGFVDIEPGSTYMRGATGPLFGSKMLFGQNLNAGQIEGFLDALENHLQLSFGMQILEDAICNWQKSPTKYKYFGG